MARSSIAVKILGDATGFNKALAESSGALGRWGGSIAKIGGKVALAGGAAIAGGVATGFFTALERQDLSAGLANNLGLTPAQAKQAGDAAASAFGAGFGESFEEAAGIASTLAGLGVDTTEALTEFTKQATAITETFAVDQTELLAATSALIDRGFVADTAEAFDLLASSAEGSFISLSEQLDLLNEYGDQINQVGLTGEEAFGLISGAASTFEADKILDTFKELAIRGQDMSSTSVAALEQLGLNAETVARAFGTGGEAAAAARDDILRAMNAIEDPIERNTIGVALMGTAFEDLGAQPLNKLISDLEVSGDAAETLADRSLSLRDRFGAFARRGQNALADLAVAFLPVVEDALPSIEAGLARATGFLRDNLPAAIETVKTAVTNLAPILQAVFDVWVRYMETVFPVVRDIVVAVFGAIRAWVDRNWPAIRDVVLAVLEQIAGWVQRNWPQIRETIVAVMTTVGEIIAAVVELTGAIWARWGDEILLVVETVFKVIGPIIQAALDTILAVIRTVTALIRGDWDAVWEGIKDIVAGALEFIVALVEGAMTLYRTYLELAQKAAKQVFSGAWDAIVRIVRSGIDTVIDWVSGIAGRVTVAAAGLVTALIDRGTQLIAGLLRAAMIGFRAVLDWVAGIPGAIVRAIGDLGETLWRTGLAVMDGLLGGLREGWKKVSGWLSDRADLIPVFKGPLDKDRRLLIPAGQAIMDGLRAGLETGWRPVADTLGGFAAQISDRLTLFDDFTFAPTVGSLPAWAQVWNDLPDPDRFAIAENLGGRARGGGDASTVIHIARVEVHDGRDLFDELDRRARLVVA